MNRVLLRPVTIHLTTDHRHVHDFYQLWHCHKSAHIKPLIRGSYIIAAINQQTFNQQSEAGACPNNGLCSYVIKNHTCKCNGGYFSETSLRSRIPPARPRDPVIHIKPQAPKARGYCCRCLKVRSHCVRVRIRFSIRFSFRVRRTVYTESEFLSVFDLISCPQLPRQTSKCDFV